MFVKNEAIATIKPTLGVKDIDRSGLSLKKKDTSPVYDRVSVHVVCRLLVRMSCHVLYSTVRVALLYLTVL